jgi:hypothetical protein
MDVMQIFAYLGSHVELYFVQALPVFLGAVTGAYISKAGLD